MIYGGTWMMEHMGRGGYRGGMFQVKLMTLRVHQET
jgi:hypothetical protein